MPAPKQNAAKRGRAAVAKTEPKVENSETMHSKPDGDTKEIVKTIGNDGNNAPSKERNKFPDLGNGDAREPQDQTENMDKVEDEMKVETIGQKKTAKGNARLEGERFTKAEFEVAAAEYCVRDDEEDDESSSSSWKTTSSVSSSSESPSEEEEEMVSEGSPVKQDRRKATNRKVMTLPKSGGRHNKVVELKSPDSRSKASPVDNIDDEEEDNLLIKELQEFVCVQDQKKEAQKAEAPKKNDRSAESELDSKSPSKTKLDNDEEEDDKSTLDEESTKEVEDPQAKRVRGEAAKIVPRKGGRQANISGEDCTAQIDEGSDEEVKKPPAKRGGRGNATKKVPETKKGGYRGKQQSKPELVDESEDVEMKITDEMCTALSDEESDEEVKKSPVKQGGRGNATKKVPEIKKGGYRGKQQSKPELVNESEDVEMKITDEMCTALSDEESDEEVKMPPVKQGGRGNATKQAPVTKKGGRRGRIQLKPESDHDSEAENGSKDECDLSPQDEESEKEEKKVPPAKRGRGKVARKAPAPKKGRALNDKIESETMQADNVDVKDDDDEESEIEEVVAKLPSKRGRGKIDKETSAPRKGGRNIKIEPELKASDDDIDEEVSSPEKPVKAVSTKRPATKRGKTASAKMNMETSDKAESAVAPTAARKRGQRVVAGDAVAAAPSSRPVRSRKPVVSSNLDVEEEKEDEREPPEKVAANKAKRAAPKKPTTSQAKKVTTKKK